MHVSGDSEFRFQHAIAAPKVTTVDGFGSATKRRVEIFLPQNACCTSYPLQNGFFFPHFGDSISVVPGLDDHSMFPPDFDPRKTAKRISAAGLNDGEQTSQVR